jgi:hypothetical protein
VRVNRSTITGNCSAGIVVSGGGFIYRYGDNMKRAKRDSAPSSLPFLNMVSPSQAAMS